MKIEGFRYIPNLNLNPSKGKLEKSLIKENIPYSVIPHYKWTYNFDLYQKKRKSSFLLAEMWLYKNKIQKKIKNSVYYSAHKKFVKQFQPDIIYVNSSMAPMGCLIAHSNNIPLVWHHRETVDDPVTGFFLEDNKKFRYFFKQTNLHLYPSQFLMNSYQVEEENSKHVVVYDGVASGNGSPRENRQNTNTIKFGIIGRINSQKGQKEVMDVFDQFQVENYNYELHVFGDGNEGYINELKTKYVNNNKFLYRGFQDHETIYNDIDFLIVNAKNESFGRVVAEANSFGVPVISVRSGALKEIVFKNINGLQYSNKDELYIILRNLFSDFYPKDFYKNLSYSSLICFENKFSIKVSSGVLYDELKRLLR